MNNLSITTLRVPLPIHKNLKSTKTWILESDSPDWLKNLRVLLWNNPILVANWAFNTFVYNAYLLKRTNFNYLLHAKFSTTFLRPLNISGLPWTPIRLFSKMFLPTVYQSPQQELCSLKNILPTGLKMIFLPQSNSCQYVRWYGFLTFLRKVETFVLNSLKVFIIIKNRIT